MTIKKLSSKVKIFIFLFLSVMFFVFTLQNSFAVSAKALLPAKPIKATNLATSASRSSGNWLYWVNYYRAMANLGPVTENPAYNDGCWKHARYMYKNNSSGHYEDKKNRWYTPEGDTAAWMSVLFPGTVNNQLAIEGWMRAPYHAIGILNPKLKQVSFGAYRVKGRGPAVLDVGSGKDWFNRIPSSSINYPIKFPADNKTTRLLTFWGGEVPDPMDCTPGYKSKTGPSKTGLPIIVQLGFSGDATSSYFKRGNKSLKHFVLDYKNCQHNSSAELILIPRKPLMPGSKYDVSISGINTDNNIPFSYQWSFFTAASPRSKSVWLSLKAKPKTVKVGRRTLLYGQLTSRVSTISRKALAGKIVAIKERVVSKARKKRKARYLKTYRKHRAKYMAYKKKYRKTRNKTLRRRYQRAAVKYKKAMNKYLRAYRKTKIVVYKTIKRARTNSKGKFRAKIRVKRNMLLKAFVGRTASYKKSKSKLLRVKIKKSKKKKRRKK